MLRAVSLADKALEITLVPVDRRQGFCQRPKRCVVDAPSTFLTEPDSHWRWLSQMSRKTTYAYLFVWSSEG